MKKENKQLVAQPKDEGKKPLTNPNANSATVAPRTSTLRTVKLKIFPIITGEGKENASKVVWKRIRQIANDSWRAANEVMTGQMFNDTLVRRIYARKKINPKEDKESVSQVENQFKDFFGVKRQATTERDIKSKFVNLPSCVTNSLNNNICSSYRQDKKEMAFGERSLRSYKRGMPIPTAKTSIAFIQTDKGYGFKWKLSKKENIEFAIMFGRDNANNCLTIQEILKENKDYGAPSIQLKNRNLFLLLPVKEELKDMVLDNKKVVGVDLGLSIPAYIAMNDSPQRRALGHYEDFVKTRVQMQYRRRRSQRKIITAKGQHGRKRKLKALNRLKDKERNFARNYNHCISKNIIDFAIKNKAGKIHLEFLKGFGKDKKDSYVLRNWSYFELQTMIQQKAKRYNIEVKSVDPYHTSQTCSKCGNYEKGQREEQSKFKCKKCGEELNADYNAALNIARSKKYVTKIEQCEYHKRLVTQPKGEGKKPLTNPEPTRCENDPEIQQLGVAG